MGRPPLIVDAGPLYAIFDVRDAHHGASRELLESHPGPLLVPMLVVAEVAYLISTHLAAAAEIKFLGDLASGEYLPEPVDAADWLRIAELVARYDDLPLGTVDASVVAAAERLGINTIASLDRRHLSVVVPRHASGFELLP